MSRQLFFAELTQYLTFVTKKEKEFILAALAAKFDEVGPQGEPGFIMELGSPMAIAIALKRRKEAGEPICPPDQECSADQEPDEAAPAEPQEELPQGARFVSLVDPAPTDVQELREEPAPSAEETLVKELLEEEEEASLTKIEAEPLSEPEIPEEEPSHQEPAEEEFIPAISSQGAAPTVEAPEPVPARSMTFGKILGAGFLSLLTVALSLVTAALACTSGYFGATLFFGGFGTLSTPNDALWLMAVGFALLSVGLFLLWLCIWMTIVVIHRLFIGKARAGTPFKLGLRRFNRILLFAALVLLLAGVGCGAGSYFTGGYIDLALKSGPGVKALESIAQGPLKIVFLLLGVTVEGFLSIL